MLTLRWRIFIYMIFIVSITTILLNFNSYTTAKNMIIQTLSIQLKNYVDITNAHIDHQDVEVVLNQVQSGVDTEQILKESSYVAVREKLAEYRETYSLKYLYIFTKNNQGEYYYLVDGFPMDYKQDDVSMPGEIDADYDKNLESLYNKEKFIISELAESDEWGATLSVYSPILNEKGEVIALIGADLEGSVIYQVLEDSKRKNIIVTTIILFMTIILSYFISKILASRLTALTKDISKVRGEDFDIQISVKGKDEVGQLGEAFQYMLQDLKSNFEKISYMARHDILTGMPNRTHFEKTLQEYIDSNPAQPFALLFLDMDGFKEINDTYGHQIGDVFLKKLAERILATVQEKGFSCRAGGDEFLIFYNKNLNKEEQLSESKRLLEELNKPYHFNAFGRDYNITSTPSIGLVFSTEYEGDIVGFIKMADNAMYEAKNSGKNKIHICKSE